MTISYPLDLRNGWPIMANTFDLKFRQSVSRNGNGQFTGIDMGYPIWAGSFSTAAMSNSDCVELQALMNSLGGLNQMMLLCDTRREYPKAHAEGTFSDTGEVLAVDLDGIRISLTGLDAGFTISVGDYFTTFFGGRRHLMQAAESVVANGAGETALFQTIPNPPYGLTAGEEITFSQPQCRMRLVPGTLAFNDNQDGTGTISWSAVQV